MKEGPSIASVAALIGDPARANMLAALMSGRALTAGELAREAGIAAPPPAATSPACARPGWCWSRRRAATAMCASPGRRSPPFWRG